MLDIKIIFEQVLDLIRLTTRLSARVEALEQYNLDREEEQEQEQRQEVEGKSSRLSVVNTIAQIASVIVSLIALYIAMRPPVNH